MLAETARMLAITMKNPLEEDLNRLLVTGNLTRIEIVDENGKVLNSAQRNLTAEQSNELDKILEFVRQNDVSAPSLSDGEGFDALDRRLLTVIIEHFDGGPVGVESLAAAIGEERGTIEDVLEPFLIQQGFLVRTARGRMVTTRCWQHFGLPAPRRATVEDLFDAGEGKA